ncbi:MAG: aminoacyl-tRNA hydrolase [Candidatus Omnitrophota bacterium]|nr:aminoacyl-tRNA hydrolase [Candidatus Omnitrophota bacterium]MBU1929786.1 aminoacyl-tRNA hydrolase [Candidatus Omnitrophota bacterium]MBU2035212.1 aminoacyl-tRNA hydrolase [Candidatus Omnitrophota bacterium]MBU2221274.1 aminoacyl-tRNA hydrolase [Candidatus Omnitrophota bacterium]
MKLIVGLGNPGPLYAGSRHNIGFSVIKALAKEYKVSLKKELRSAALSGRCKIDGFGVILAMPLTFMNRSGLAVSSLLKKYKIEFENLLVICDDLDLELGRQKIKLRGSSAGHKGIQSIIDSLSNDEFARLRVGIGRPDSQRVDITEFVLSGFSKREVKEKDRMVEEACKCSLAWIGEGAIKAMNIFNKKISVKTKKE